MSKCHTAMCMEMSVRLWTQQMDGGLAAVMSWEKSHPPREGEIQGACWGVSASDRALKCFV